MKNTDIFYSKAAEFQSKRKAITDAYEKRLNELEKAKGSQLYTEERGKAADARNTALQALQIEYRETFRATLDAMANANGKRGATPPTADQLSILQALQMRDTVALEELNRAANSCKDNALAISVLNEIARKNGHMRTYRTESGDMSAADVDQAINGLRKGLADFMAHDTPRAARIAAENHAALYGKAATERPLPKRQLFTDKESCFNALFTFSMDKEAFAAFCAAVDGDGEGAADK